MQVGQILSSFIGPLKDLFSTKVSKAPIAPLRQPPYGIATPNQPTLYTFTPAQNQEIAQFKQALVQSGLPFVQRHSVEDSLHRDVAIVEWRMERYDFTFQPPSRPWPVSFSVTASHGEMHIEGNGLASREELRAMFKDAEKLVQDASAAITNHQRTISTDGDYDREADRLRHALANASAKEGERKREVEQPLLSTTFVRTLDELRERLGIPAVKASATAPKPAVPTAM